MKAIRALALGLTLGLAASPAFALEELVESVAEGCSTELETRCADVTPGNGRLLACLFAYGDQLSGKCEYALFDAANQLERFVSNIAYLVDECYDDAAADGADVAAGEGRIAQCLLDNRDALSRRCSAAIDAVDLKVE